MHRQPELIITDALLSAVSAGKGLLTAKQVAELRVIRTGLERQDPHASVQLWSFLKANRSADELAVEGISDVVLEFVASETSRLAAIRGDREFTDAEKEYGKVVLPNLLESLRELTGSNAAGADEHDLEENR